MFVDTVSIADWRGGFPPLHSIIFFQLLKALLNFFQSFENDLRTCGNACYTRAGSVEDGVQYSRVRCIQRSLAAAGGTVRSVGTRVVLLVYELDVIGNIAGIRNTALEKAGVYLEVFEVFGECEADALCKTAVEVAVDSELIEDSSDVSDSRELFDLYLAGRRIDSDLGEEYGVHVRRERIALAGCLIEGNGGGKGEGSGHVDILALLDYAVCYALIIGPVGPVSLFEDLQQVLGSDFSRVAGHNGGT